MWDLWWTKWHWGRFSPSTSASHSTDCSTFIIIRGWDNRPVNGRCTKWTQSYPTPRNKKRKLNCAYNPCISSRKIGFGIIHCGYNSKWPSNVMQRYFISNFTKTGYTWRSLFMTLYKVEFFWSVPPKIGIMRQTSIESLSCRSKKVPMGFCANIRTHIDGRRADTICT
jgi:hypothetical protein